MILIGYIIDMMAKDAINVMMVRLMQAMYSPINVSPVTNTMKVNVSLWAIIPMEPTVFHATLSAPHPPQITLIAVWGVMW
jgi:hypothetical protein